MLIKYIIDQIWIASRKISKTVFDPRAISSVVYLFIHNDLTDPNSFFFVG